MAIRRYPVSPLIQPWPTSEPNRGVCRISRHAKPEAGSVPVFQAAACRRRETLRTRATGTSTVNLQVSCECGGFESKQRVDKSLPTMMKITSDIFKGDVAATSLAIPLS